VKKGERSVAWIVGRKEKQTTAVTKRPITLAKKKSEKKGGKPKNYKDNQNVGRKKKEVQGGKKKIVSK